MPLACGISIGVGPGIFFSFRLVGVLMVWMIGGEGEVEARVSGGEWEMYPVCFGGLGRVLL